MDQKEYTFKYNENLRPIGLGHQSHYRSKRFSCMNYGRKRSNGMIYHHAIKNYGLDAIKTVEDIKIVRSYSNIKANCRIHL